VVEPIVSEYTTRFNRGPDGVVATMVNKALILLRDKQSLTASFIFSGSSVIFFCAVSHSKAVNNGDLYSLDNP
jgi:hypothetical protein